MRPPRRPRSPIAPIDKRAPDLGQPGPTSCSTFTVRSGEGRCQGAAGRQSRVKRKGDNADSVQGALPLGFQSVSKCPITADAGGMSWFAAAAPRRLALPGGYDVVCGRLAIGVVDGKNGVQRARTLHRPGLDTIAICRDLGDGGLHVGAVICGSRVPPLRCWRWWRLREGRDGLGAAGDGERRGVGARPGACPGAGGSIAAGALAPPSAMLFPADTAGHAEGTATMMGSMCSII